MYSKIENKRQNLRDIQISDRGQYFNITTKSPQSNAQSMAAWLVISWPGFGFVCCLSMLFCWSPETFTLIFRHISDWLLDKDESHLQRHTSWSPDKFSLCPSYAESMLDYNSYQVLPNTVPVFIMLCNGRHTTPWFKRGDRPTWLSDERNYVFRQIPGGCHF